MNIHLGFEVGTGAPVSVPLHHACITGLTRLSGKTTAAEGLLSRLPAEFTGLVFRTKRGGGFLRRRPTGGALLPGQGGLGVRPVAT